MARKFFEQKPRKRNHLAPPRIIIIGEGETEKSLPHFVKKILDDTPYQVIDNILKIQNSDSIPAEKIAKDIQRISSAAIEMGRAEHAICVIDLEARNTSWKNFKNEIISHMKDRIVVGVTSRSIESWMLGHLDGMIAAISPNIRPNPKRFQKVDNVDHPAENIIKSYWKNYSKRRDGQKFLTEICPTEVAKRSDSCKDFLTEIKQNFTKYSQ